MRGYRGASSLVVKCTSTVPTSHMPGCAFVRARAWYRVSVRYRRNSYVEGGGKTNGSQERQHVRQASKARYHAIVHPSRQSHLCPTFARCPQSIPLANVHQEEWRQA